MKDNTKKGTWIDAIQMNKENPQTFEIPSAEDIAKLHVDSVVKIGIVGLHPLANIIGERFWVKLKNIYPDGTFIGTVDNDLELTKEHNLSYGDEVIFERRNILNIYHNYR